MEEYTNITFYLVQIDPYSEWNYNNSLVKQFSYQVVTQINRE